jgi:hypothetical protein
MSAAKLDPDRLAEGAVQGDDRGRDAPFADDVGLPADMSRGDAFGRDDSPPLPELRTLADLLAPSVDRAERRAKGKEKAVPLPWPSVADHFGGGLWPGAHFLTAGTGIGKTVLGLQCVLHAARAGLPALYVGLELEQMQIALRLIGEASGVPWSALYLGKAGPAWISRAREAIPKLQGLPIYIEHARPQGWPVRELAHLIRAIRAKHPQPEGPGSLPVLVVLDYLQIVGAENDAHGRPLDLRERIGRASYFCRYVAEHFDVANLIVSSIARDKYNALGTAVASAGLKYESDDAGRPVNRSVLNPDALVGLGKESGEIEFSADSVSVLVRVPETRKPSGAVDMLFVTAKGRATGACWSPLHFTNWSYREADDGGSQTVRAMQEAEEAREAKREAKKSAKEQAKVDKLVADAAAIVRYVQAHPKCTVKTARLLAVGDNPRRWAPAVELLGNALQADGGLTIDLTKLPEQVRACMR